MATVNITETTNTTAIQNYNIHTIISSTLSKINNILSEKNNSHLPTLDNSLLYYTLIGDPHILMLLSDRSSSLLLWQLLITMTNDNTNK